MCGASQWEKTLTKHPHTYLGWKRVFSAQEAVETENWPPSMGWKSCGKLGLGGGMEQSMPKARLWILGPKNPFCRLTWYETVGCALWGWWTERLMRRDMIFLWSQTDLGLNSNATTYEHWNLGRKSLKLSDSQFLSQQNGNKIVVSNEDWIWPPCAWP